VSTFLPVHTVNCVQTLKALIKQLAELDAEYAVAEIEDKTPTAAADNNAEVNAEIQKELEIEREKQAALAAQLEALNSKLNATQTELTKAKKVRSAKLIKVEHNKDAYLMDADAIVILHREATDTVDDAVASSRASQRAHMQARLATARRHREEEQAAKVAHADQVNRLPPIRSATGAPVLSVNRSASTNPFEF
jgi:hypothetical protein